MLWSDGVGSSILYLEQALLQGILFLLFRRVHQTYSYMLLLCRLFDQILVQTF